MLTLHGYWRSGTSYRTRLALALKGIPYEQASVDLRQAEHRADAFLSRNPQGLVPTLILADGTALSQSPAIIEYLEEAYPERPLLPPDPVGRARARQMAAVIGCDVHPLGNLRVLKALKADYGAEDEDIEAWQARWMSDGFAALEALAGAGKGPFLGGTDRPGLPECYLLPQLYGARRYGVPLEAYPRLLAAEAATLALPEVQPARPENQPDAD